MNLKIKSENIIYAFLCSIFIIAVLPKAIQMIVISLFLFGIIFIEKKFYIDKKMKFLCVFVFIYILSAVTSAIGSVEVSRIFATINTIALWIYGILFFSYVSKLQINRNKVNKILFFNMMIFTILGITVMILKMKNYNFSNSILKRLVAVDWANNEKSYRFSCMMEYPNLAVLYYFIVNAFAYNYIKDRKISTKLIYITSTIIPVIIVNSRIGIILAIINYIFYLPEIIKNKTARRNVIIIIVMIMIVVVAFNGENLFNKVEKLINSRGDSTSMRSSIYQNSIKNTIERSVLFGSGIKIMFHGYPLGSHSTFIGVFYKSGLVGLFFFLVTMFNLGYQYLKLGKLSRINKIYAINFLSLCVMMCIEDIDGANWLCILFFILTGIHLNAKGEYDGKKV